MSARSKAALRILAASAQMQGCVADMLESKASDMESLRDWVLETARWSDVQDENVCVMRTCDFHTLLVDILQSAAKMETGLAAHLRLLIEEEEVLPDNPFAADGGMLSAEGGGL